MTVSPRWSPVAWVLAVLAALGTSASVSLGQEGGGYPGGVQLHISALKSPVQVGEPIKIKVEILNGGKEDVFIGRTMPQISGWIYSLLFNVMTPTGKGTARTVEGPPFVLPPSPRESFSAALAKDWVLLPVGYSYGTTVSLDSSFFPALGKPGRYQIQASYSSRGMGAPLYYNPLFRSPDKIAQLPGKSWVGLIGSNIVWVKIVPAAQSSGSNSRSRAHPTRAANPAS